MRNKSLYTALLGAGLFTSGTALAGPFTLPDIPLYLTFNSAEQLSVSNDINNTLNPAAGGATEGNWGIVQITTIQAGTALAPTGSDIQGGGGNIFTSPTLQNPVGPQILGIWYGVQITSVGSNATNPSTATGGTLDLYYFDSSGADVGAELNNSTNLAKRTAQDEYTGYTCASGNTSNCTFLVSLDFAGGALPSDYTTTITTPAAIPGDSTSKSYLNVNTSKVGAWTAQLDTNYFTLDAEGNPVGTLDPNGVAYAATDVRLDNNFSINGATAWSVASTDITGLRDNDPARAYAQSIPEPGTLALMAASLLGLGIIRRRKTLQ